MPPKKIGYSAKRSMSFSSTRPRKQVRMKGYNSGARIMDKSFKTVASIFTTQNYKTSRYKYLVFNEIKTLDNKKSNSYYQASLSNRKELLGIIFLVISVLLFILGFVFLFQGSFFVLFFIDLIASIFLLFGLKGIGLS